MSFRDGAVGGRTFVSNSSASADRRMAGAFAKIVSEGITFTARSHGILMPLSLIDEAGVFHSRREHPLGPTNLTPGAQTRVTEPSERRADRIEDVRNPRGDSAIQSSSLKLARLARLSQLGALGFW